MDEDMIGPIRAAASLASSAKGLFRFGCGVQFVQDLLEFLTVFQIDAFGEGHDVYACFLEPGGGGGLPHRRSLLGNRFPERLRG